MAEKLEIAGPWYFTPGFTPGDSYRQGKGKLEGGLHLSIYRKANSSFYLYMHQYSLSYITLGKEIWKNIIACNLDNLVYYKQFKVQKQKHFHCTVAGVIL